MIINRVIDNAAVAAASLTRAPVSAARQQALDHAVSVGGVGATVFGCALDRAHQPRVGGVGERRRRARARLPRHVPRGRLLAPGRQHPADPRRRAARRRRRRGARARARDRLRDPDRPGARDLPAQAQDRPRRPPRPVGRRRHRHAARPRRRDDLPGRRPGAAHDHRDAAVAQGRDLDVEGARARPSRARWRSRPSTARCAARPRRAPIYEGEDGVIAWMLDGPDASYEVPLPGAGRGQARHPRLVHEGALGRVPGAGVDRPRAQAPRRAPRRFATRRTSSRSCCTPSHHTHYVIGSGANDPQKYDPTASRETLDHSIPYIFAVALQDGGWHHVDSYAPERAGRADTVELWHKVTTAEDAGVDAPLPLGRPEREGVRRPRRDHARRRRDRSSTRSPSPTRTRSAPGRSPARTTSASSGCSPSRCSSADEIERFLDLAQRLPELTPEEVQQLTIVAELGVLAGAPAPKGLF